MNANVNLRDLSLSNFDQILQVDEVKGGKRYNTYTSFSVKSFTRNSFSVKSVTSRKRRRK